MDLGLIVQYKIVVSPVELRLLSQALRASFPKQTAPTRLPFRRR